ILCLSTTIVAFRDVKFVVNLSIYASSSAAKNGAISEILIEDIYNGKKIISIDTRVQ
ncbi:6498_t:CDS:2, partial [Gigaspora rosea]